ncbi:MAG: glycosyl hydrolase [Chloroflexi bacterium]|nr:glycosyl hydrolase [Chloroflexota bacterium]MDA8187055.1 glycosyl hydrolase [Dehalococcoidales bacterium]
MWQSLRQAPPALSGLLGLFLIIALSSHNAGIATGRVWARPQLETGGQNEATYAVYLPQVHGPIALPSPTATPTHTLTPTVSPTHSATPSPTLTITPVPDLTPSPTLIPTAVSDATPSPTQVSTPVLDPTPSSTPAPQPTPVPVPRGSVRFGVAGAGYPGRDSKANLDAMGIYSYYEYDWGEPLPGKERIQMVARNYISDSGLDNFIRSHPGMYWQIGNEPNVPNQDNLTPTQYAQRYHDWAQRIKAIDPSAKLLNAGIVNYPDIFGIPGGVPYLRDFRESYRSLYGAYPQVDVWNIHAFPPFYQTPNGKLHSYCDTAMLKQFVSDAVQYLRSAGESNPVWLSEFGMDWADDPDPCTLTFMKDMINWLKQTRLVDRWYWWTVCAWCLDGKGGSLFGTDGNLSALGQTWRDLAAQDASPNVVDNAASTGPPLALVTEPAETQCVLE